MMEEITYVCIMIYNNDERKTLHKTKLSGFYMEMTLYKKQKYVFSIELRNNPKSAYLALGPNFEFERHSDPLLN